MITANSDFISEIDIITQVGMIEPLIENLAAISGVFQKDIEIIGSFARKNFDKTNKPCIDLMIPVDNQQTAQRVLKYFGDIPGPSKKKGYMIELLIGWGWIGIIPAICTNSKNYFYFVNYEENYYFKTNPVMHVNYLRNVGSWEVVKILKSELQNEEIDINLFILEVLVVEALKDFNKVHENMKYKKVLEYLASKFHQIDLLDPANHENEISRGLRVNIREQLRIFAIKALKNFEGGGP